MGWLFTRGQTRKELIAERTKGWVTKGASTRCIAHCTRGNVLWIVVEQYIRATGHFERFIECDLLQTERGFGWGYKDMDESMHPYYYSCPVSYLDMGTRVLCQEWRNEVRKYAAFTNRKIEKGAFYTLKNANVSWKQVEVVSLRPLRIKSPYGSIHKIAKRLLGEKVLSA
jgi:hypothetical protein